MLVPLSNYSSNYCLPPPPPSSNHGALVGQWVKGWPTDLAVPSSIPARGGIISTVTHSLLLSTSHRPDMTEILLKGRKIQVIHQYSRAV